ncbi:bifunctional diguanylate cyclase/phosphodiesterase [Bermanella marisrubri]|uniref:Response regulator/GGDEF domain/EAL domain protein n=1 Tax=Bermanella marisrubri TaxID=207949 RepID=Q1N439_9GAMM|nr:bifunctional diguanylate cyclase/phosphodiesterase [Bermanella marisrubri]EAT13026.1 response regulator/GGDEF domain/EAL domain protein [Oceanobacter sp. RED65] [Bermanella marisrubri]QIZ82848.1 bifunctional diguanylate cyclase/phosphodiesterase [Bermanella marisrubri]
MKISLFSALKIAITYAVFAGAWILFSDVALQAAVHDIALLSQLQTFKGWFFVLVTSVLLFAMVSRSVQTSELLNQFDPLTGLLNHHMFSAQLERKVAMRKPEQTLVVIYLDIDHFSHLNRALGFNEANQILMGLSRALKDHYSAHVLLGRFPPDQFAIAFLSDKSMGEIEAGIKGLRQMFDQYMYEQQVEVTCTLGVAMGPSDSRQAKGLMAAASDALGHAKTRERNSVQFFNKQLSELENQRQKLLGDLRQDLAANRLNMVYQPQYRLADQTLVGVEALIRWEHAEHGFISPDVFIPLAEDNSIANEISRFVVHQVYQDLQQYRLLGNPIERVSINISAVEFNSRMMLDALLMEIESLPNLKQWLQIEITETATLNNLEKSAANIKALKAEGLRFSVDDFGTGYTSLAMLKDLPIDEVKIDRSFIKAMVHETKAKAIVEAIVGMTHGFGISIVAEGIENKEQLDLLKVMGCSEGQGYFLAKPLNVKQLAATVRSGL